MDEARVRQIIREEIEKAFSYSEPKSNSCFCNCRHCGSSKTQWLTTPKSNKEGKITRRVYCQSCKKTFTVALEESPIIALNPDNYR